jgi:hypothetical protein
LSELPADKATGQIKDIYEAIEAALGVRLVNLVYRHLATVPGALEWAWYTVGAPFQAGVFAERSKALIPANTAKPQRQISPRSEGLSSSEAGQVIATLDAYNRANPMNALSLRVIALALEAGRPAIACSFDRPAPVSLPELLPMAPLDQMEPGTRDLMQRLARLTTGGDSKIVPSLFRHFAPWPGLLRRLADAMEEMAVGGVIDDEAKRVFEKANRIALDIFNALPPPDTQALLPDPATRKMLVDTIEIFPPTICRMIVIAGLLRAAIAPDTAKT